MNATTSDNPVWRNTRSHTRNDCYDVVRVTGRIESEVGIKRNTIGLQEVLNLNNKVYDCPIWLDQYLLILIIAGASPHLSTQLEVCHDDGHLGAGDDEDHKHKKEETKQVVELVLPDCLREGAHSS